MACCPRGELPEPLSLTSTVCAVGETGGYKVDTTALELGSGLEDHGQQDIQFSSGIFFNEQLLPYVKSFAETSSATIRL